MTLREVIKNIFLATTELFTGWRFLVYLNLKTWFLHNFIYDRDTEHFIDYEVKEWEERNRWVQIKHEIDEMLKEIERGGQ